MQLSKNFTLSEFAIGEVSGYVKTNLIVLASELQKLRDHFGIPVLIHTGVNSISADHREGKAAVFSIPGRSGDQIKAVIESKLYKGTIRLMDHNQVYYSLSKPENLPVSEPPIVYPAEQIQSDKNKKTLMLGAALVMLIAIGAMTFKGKEH